MSEINEDQSRIEYYHGEGIILNNRTYYPIITIYSNEELTELESDLNLQQVKVQIFVDQLDTYTNEVPAAEIFSYLEQEN
ncbi:hypothetical protein [Alkalibacillus haloalkaliphilus]|uniref:hypothetical protein n=1 Tax=Alkalibacillus haloalkaliphilus TaxID=94136 RepID=UPI0003096A33|nr:hypothetical protein [Alkalibacillus haloalkaliphilus]